MYIFAVLIITISLACTFIESIESPRTFGKAALAALAMFAFVYIMNL